MFVYCNLLPGWMINYRYILKQSSAVNLTLCFTIILTMLIPVPAGANRYSIPENGSRLIGSQELYEVKPGDYFHSIAQFYNIGLIALMESNPGIDPFLPTPGTKLQIPIRMLLPDVPYRGIVINLPELRLYYFEKGTNTVHVFPVGIGRIGRLTPIMRTTIMSRIENPSWTPSSRIRAEYLQKYGRELARTVPAGKENPLGDYALQLAFGDNDYLIHGTNQNFGIGMRVSSGCIRMNPEDIAWLFQQVAIGEPVRIIDQPIKVATEANGENLLEVHSPLSVNEDKDEYNLIWVGDKVKFNNRGKVNNQKVKKALLLHQGLPVNVDL